jgi:Mrp family chromosome partitioning ATPase/capsular polysaccharide biosynthesis protein
MSTYRDKTLGDYAAMMRRGLPIIIAVGVVCGAVALGISLVAKKSYQAQASLAIQDPNQALALAGTSGGISTQTQVQLALSHAPRVTRPEVVDAVRSSLRSRLSSQALLSSVSVSVDPNSGLIDVSAHSRSATQAAAIANGFAQRDAALTTSEVRRQYAVQATQLAKKLLSGSAAKDPATKLLYQTQLERLQSLSSVATPVQVNSTAQVPGSPASPKPVTYTVVALIIGLLLGMVVVSVREALEQRVRDPNDVEGLVGHPVVGQVRGEALGRSGAHANGSLNGVAPLEPADEEAFRILRQNVRYFATDSLRTVLVTSASPQEGKSTVAACLAATTVAAGQRTLLVECDLRRPVLAARLGLSEGPGLTDYLTGNAQPAEIVRSVPTVYRKLNGAKNGDKGSPVYVEDQRLVCITAGTRPPRPAELLASERFRSFLTEVSGVYDCVILDSPPLLTVADALEIVPSVSAVLLCVRLRQTTRDQVRAAQAALERLPERPLGTVITGLRKSDRGYRDYYSTYYSGASA